MAKQKQTEPEQMKTISLERYDVTIDPADVTEVQDFGQNVHVTVKNHDDGTEATYNLTRDEAADLLPKTGQIAQER